MKQERIVELWLKSGHKLEVKRNCQKIRTRIDPDQSSYIVTFSECEENGYARVGLIDIEDVVMEVRERYGK
jgi:hypothetical protein